MAINIITINGTDSIAASRVTLNNNFTEVKTKVDPILDSFDTNNGVFNISALTNGQLIAKKLTITTAGIAVQGGAVTLAGASNLTMSGGDLTLTTGSAILSGGATINGVTLASASVLRETGTLSFAQAAIDNTNVKRTFYLDDTSQTSIQLDPLSTTAEAQFVNNSSATITLTFADALSDFAQQTLGTTISILQYGTATMKFIKPTNAADGKWWYMGGHISTIA